MVPVHCQLAEPHWFQSAVDSSHSWTQLGSTELMEVRPMCSYASCDGPVHCLLCVISLVPYLIPTSRLYENAPFRLIKVCFLTASCFCHNVQNYIFFLCIQTFSTHLSKPQTFCCSGQLPHLESDKLPTDVKLQLKIQSATPSVNLTHFPECTLCCCTSGYYSEVLTAWKNDTKLSWFHNIENYKMFLQGA